MKTDIFTVYHKESIDTIYISHVFFITLCIIKIYFRLIICSNKYLEKSLTLINSLSFSRYFLIVKFYKLTI